MKMSEKEKIAILETFKALHKAGVEVNSLKEANETIELAARMLSYVTGEPKMTVDALKIKMLELMLDTLTVH